MWGRIKRLVKIVLITLLASILFAVPVVWWQWDGIREEFLDAFIPYWKSQVQAAIRAGVKDLPAVDKVVVMRFENKPVSVGQKKYATAILGGQLYIAKEVSLIGSDAEAIASIWRKLNVGKDFTACHEPHHAVRFYGNGRQLTEFIICFHCSNASLPVSFGRELVGLDDTKPEYQALQARIEALVGPAN